MRKVLVIWELPQLLLGFLFYLGFRKNIIRSFKYRHSTVFISKGVQGGLSLGWMIFLNPGANRLRLITHEYGHSMQSLCLGWLYLPLVGLPSAIRSWLWRKKQLSVERYFKRFPENWADRLGKALGKNYHHKPSK